MGDWVNYQILIFTREMSSLVRFLFCQPPFRNSHSQTTTPNNPLLSCEIEVSPSPGRLFVALFGRGRAVLLTLALALAAMLFSSVPAQAAGDVGAFLQWGAGARSLGMGRAYMGVSDDASATYWNPAGMVQLPRKELMALQATLFEDTTYTFLSYVHPSSKYGVWGINMTRLESDGFEKLEITVDPLASQDDPDILSITNVGNFTVSQEAMTLAYGKQVTNKLAMGMSIKRITNTIDTFSQSFMAVDASVFAKVKKNYRVGFAVKNAVTQAPAESDDRLPLIIRIGNAYSLLNDRILLAADIQSGGNSGMGWNLGSEYKPTRKVAIRLGLENRDGEVAETTAGMGFQYKKLHLDFAVGLSNLGMSQRYSLSWKFGKTSSDERQKQMKRLIRSGNAAFARGNYAKAVARLEAAYSVDPSNKQIRSMIDKLQGIAGTIPAATGDGEVDRLVRQGISAWVGGDMTTAYDSLRTAFEKNPSNERLMRFTNRVARKAGQPTVEPSRSSVSGARWTLIDQKLHDALTAIYEGRYDVSINKCEEVLRIDPANVTAIGRMGAAFFLLGEKDKAIRLWKRALELEPDNRTAIEYLKQLGEK